MNGQSKVTLDGDDRVTTGSDKQDVSFLFLDLHRNSVGHRALAL